MVGTMAAGDGRFELAVSPGVHRIVVSMLGFKSATSDVDLSSGELFELNLSLESTTLELGVVEVTPPDGRWLRRLERFERALFGTSSFADSVRLVNPEVLDFRLRFGQLSATASAPLVIENRALGYRLHYDLGVFEETHTLVRFHGEPFFEELTPDSDATRRRWQANREVAFRGSLRHLLLSLIDGSTEDEGFELVHRPDEGPAALARATPTGLAPRRRPIGASDILQPVERDSLFSLAFRGMVEVTYLGEPEDDNFPEWDWNLEPQSRPAPFQRSLIYLERPRRVIVDHRGELADPFLLVRQGYFAFRRLSMLLPVEYRPEELTSAERSIR